MVTNHLKEIRSQILLNIFFCLLALIFILPIVTIISVSFSSNQSIVAHGYQLVPSEINLEAYKHIFRNPSTIMQSYIVTIFVSAMATLMMLVICSMAAYALSMKDFTFRAAINFYFLFTMLFSGGMIPTYILITQILHLKNLIWVMILPYIGAVWFMFLMRTFFRQLPYDIFEAAKMDGAGNSFLYYHIVIPLSKPIFAVVGLFQLLYTWNSWMPAMLYIDDKNLYPLQYLLQIMLRNVQEILNDMQNNMADYQSIRDLPTDSLRMAMCIIAAGPMLVIFPFFQKYFEKGIIIGSVKG